MQHSNIFPLIFTDLDGTLLDHNTYSAEPADALVHSLHTTGSAHVIPVTSKTQSELALLEREVCFRQSIKVLENGAIVQSPANSVLSRAPEPKTLFLGVSYGTILEAVRTLPDELRRHMTGFSDMTVAEVRRQTGLNAVQAERAKDRQATEPFLWSGTNEQLEELKVHVAARGIQLQQGGRFYHLTGTATKMRAMQTIIRAFEENYPHHKIVSIALGDGPNDLQMIETADYGVIMPNPGGASIRSSQESVRVAKAPGPEGWVLAVKDILRDLGMQEH